MVKMSSKWTSSDGKIFIVLGTVDLEGKRWVYYRLETPEEHLPSEFSCREESFLARFRPVV